MFISCLLCLSTSYFEIVFNSWKKIKILYSFFPFQQDKIVTFHLVIFFYKKSKNKNKFYGFCLLRTKWTRQCLLLSWEISWTTFKSFFSRAPNSFLWFLNRNLSGQAGVCIREDFSPPPFPPPWRMTSYFPSPAIVWLCGPRETDWRPQFWVLVTQKNISFYFQNLTKNLKKSWVQAECNICGMWKMFIARRILSINWLAI